MKKIRWGIAAPGRIAKKFANDMQYVDNAELTAVASTSIERGHAFANNYNIPNVFVGYNALFESNVIDAVYVAAPHNFHFDISAAALHAGKAVLCEKPLTDSYIKTEKLINIAQQKNVFLAEGMWTYFNPIIQKIQTYVSEGKIGKIKHIKADFGKNMPHNINDRLYNPKLAGGCMLDLGCYPLAFANLFIDESPTSQHIIGKRADTGVDNDVILMTDYGDISSAIHCTLEYELQNKAIITGDKGSIVVPDFWHAHEAFIYIGTSLEEHIIDNREAHGFNYEIESISRDLLAGKIESQVMPHKYSLRLSKQMDDILTQF